VVDPQTLAIEAATLEKKFEHKRCLVGDDNFTCWFGIARFTRERFQEDLQAIAKLFQQRGFPAVRVRTDFDPVTSFVRRTHKVPITLTIDPRRKLDVAF
jgi:outer membrane protein assembly factor BamA